MNNMNKVSVMVNFVCQFGWAMAPKYLVNHSRCFSEGIF